MSESAKYDAYKEKLQGVCDENNLVYRFCCDKYPITLTIRPVTGLDAQLSMLESVEEGGYTSPDASIVFTFKDGVLGYKMDKRFTIGDALFSKIKNLFKNMHYTWLQYFYRDIIERGVLTAKTMPVIDEDADSDGLPPEAEPVETFEDGDGAGGGDDGPPEEDGEGEQEPAIDPEDPLILEASKIVRSENSASVSLLQRRMGIGYSKAARLIDALEERGVVGPFNGSAPREVLPCDLPEDPDPAGEPDDGGGDDGDEA